MVLLATVRVSGPVAPVPGLDSIAPPKRAMLPEIVVSMTLSAAELLELAGVVLRMAESRLWLPVTLSRDRVSVP